MQLSHAHHKISARFDDPNLVSCVGLVPVAALAERVGLPQLLERLTVPAAHAGTKLLAVVLGMVAGADSITDLDLLRHGAMRRLFAGVRAPSTLGTFLRHFTFGHVRQLDAVGARLLAALVNRTPLLPGRDQITYLDVDDTVRETHGYAKAGAGRGYTGAKGLNVLLATLSTPGRVAGSVPVIAAARLRRGSANSVGGAWKLVADALATARRAGAGGLVIVRADSAAHRAQGELFAAYRYHAIFTDSPMSMLDAEAAHRDHAIIEQVIADLKHSALAHLPSGNFPANAAWLAAATMAYNLTQAAGALAGSIHARARTATLRARLINVAGRVAGSARRLVLHLPERWPWEAGLDELLRRALHDPLPAHTT